MTTSTPGRAAPSADPAVRPEPAPRGRTADLLRPLLLRLHFLAGLFVAPFVLVAAVSGGLYALTPVIERPIYADLLTVDPVTAPLPLADQVLAATAAAADGTVPGVDADAPGMGGDVVAVRPAPDVEGTTRVMLDDGTLPESTTRAVFVHPGTGVVLGSEYVYGTSGAMPVHTWVGLLHRQLHLGEAGRLYSELAASWLWVVALGGLALWVGRARRKRSAKALVVPQTSGPRRARLRSWHGVVGLGLVLGMLMLSATGLTWSRFAGTNITDLRAAAGWSNPALEPGHPPGAGAEVVPEDSPDAASGAADEHADHGGAGEDMTADEHAAHSDEEHAAVTGEDDGHAGHGSALPTTTADWSGVDDVLASARAADITAGKLEIKPPADVDEAWTVTEIDRGFPTQVDAVAVDGSTGEVVSDTRFADYPFMAKMARWGVDVHMGSMFGLVNQVALAVLAAGVAAVTVLGYRMWWSRRPPRGPWWRLPAAPARGGLRRLPLPVLVPLVLVVVAVGYALPMLAASLVVFLVADTAVGAVRRRRQQAPATT